MRQSFEKSTLNIRGAQRGVSLIITLIMLVVIGLTASAVMRGSISSERVVNNMRSEALAQQYAEAALEYCEAQMNLPSASRVAGLQDGALTTVAVGGATVWDNVASWKGGVAKAVTVPTFRLASVDSSFTPQAPECLVERQTLADGSLATVVTARGFSPGYSADSTSGVTTAGSVVWLQSMLALN